MPLLAGIALSLLSLFWTSLGVAAACDPMCPNCVESQCVCPPGTGGQACEFSAATLYFEHASHLYRGFRPRAIDLQGWNARRDLYRNVLASIKAQTIIEVGVWKGASSILFAEYLQEQGHGMVLSVDTWLGALEFWSRRLSGGRPDPSRDLMFRHGHPSIYYTFLSNVVGKNVTDFVIPFPVPSRLASDLLHEKKVQADFIHIDAAHEYSDVMEDLKLWYRNLRPGGIMMGDDYMPGWPGVMQAADEFSRQCSTELHIDGVKWWLMKPY